MRARLRRASDTLERALGSTHSPSLAKTHTPHAPYPVSQNLASKREVKVERVPDLLGSQKPGWNNSTLSENMSGKHTFPDRPMMRQLAKYDSHKRADFNFRAEELELDADPEQPEAGSRFPSGS